MSAALARLRRHFGDELLARRGSGYELTALGVVLLDRSQVACEMLDRAGADVEVTAQVFFHLVRAADEMPQLSDLAALVQVAGRAAKCNIPVQGQFF